MVSVGSGGLLVVWDTDLSTHQPPVPIKDELDQPLILSAVAISKEVCQCCYSVSICVV